MTFLFNALTAKLQEITELRWIDLDKGQIDRYDLRPPLAFPAVLIGIQYTRAESIGNRSQQVEALINLRLVVDYSGPTSAATPTQARQESLSYFQLAESVFDKLQGHKEAQFNRLDRRSMREERRQDGLKVINIAFATNFIEEVTTS